MGILLDKIKNTEVQYGSNYPKLFTSDLFSKMRTPDRFVSPIPTRDMRKGRFYFLMYDLGGKSTKMEKFSPVFVVDFKKVKGINFVYGVSLNFLPTKIRIAYFDALLDVYKNVISANSMKDAVGKEYPIDNVKFETTYKDLESIGFEYVIREFDSRLINKSFEVSTDYLDKYLLMDTSVFTGVPELKMAEIWMAKIGKQEERKKQMLARLQKDYADMVKTMSDNIKNRLNDIDAINKDLESISKI